MDILIIFIVFCCCLMFVGIGIAVAIAINNQKEDKTDKPDKTSSSPVFRPWEQVIKSKRRNNFCLDVPNGSKDNNVQLVSWDCTGGDNQKWSMDGFSRLVNKNSGKCMDSTGLGTAVQWDCHNGDNQKWDYDEQGRLHPKSAINKCLDITGNSDVNGAKIMIGDCHDGSNQQWYL